MEIEFVTISDGVAKIRNLQINFPYTWNSSDTTDGSSDKGYEGRNRKDTVINSEGRKLVPTVLKEM